KAAGGLGHPRLHVLQRDVDVAREVELDVDAGRALPRGGGDLRYALDRSDGVLDEVDDVRLHDLGRGALVGELDVDDREVDVGVLADAQAPHHAAEPREADQPEADEAGHEHPGEDMVSDGDVCQRAPFGDLGRVFMVFRISAARLSAALARRCFRVAVFVAMHHCACAEAEPPETPPGAVWTSMPSARRSEPSTTTLSPGVMPERIS